ncbi:LysM peptidoglycan-binding domain-containing protein [Heyndrickxia acidiproducens]|uniref:LysM peptidoglycan-binding domain-containing protein n=1 Tax=Heyndrickxia acidiproducens TaxID=1121084 RepID=UPI000377A48E|nr:LysM peptidoglycan-binding domain-containing protein [Heyndrickxia acidiproducens]
MSQSQSSIRFSLEELIWFKKGQEVEELLSISLDPHITILERDQFVVIKGNLHLSGEYIGCGEEEGEEVLFRKYVQSVQYRQEDGVFEFYQSFPVDVTIPIARITSLDELDVNIEGFDYQFHGTDCLKLNADLAIEGIADSDIEEDEEETASFPLRDDSVIHPAHIEDGKEFAIESPEEQVYGIPDWPQPEFENQTFADDSPREEKEESWTAIPEIGQQATDDVAEESIENYEEVRAGHAEESSAEKDEAKESGDDGLYEPFTVEARAQPQAEPEQAWKQETQQQEPNILQPVNLLEDEEESAESVLHPVHREQETKEESEPFPIRTEEEPEEEPAPPVIQVAQETQEPEEEPASHPVRVEQELKEASKPHAVHVEEELQGEPELHAVHAEQEPEEEPELYAVRAEKEWKEETVSPTIRVKQNEEPETEESSSSSSVEKAEAEEESSEKEETPKKKKKSKFESISLTDFFARKIEEKPAKLKICIVQEGETLDLLAEKYDINVQQILRMNHLEVNQDVYAGQVLYVPSYARAENHK